MCLALENYANSPKLSGAGGLRSHYVQGSIVGFPRTISKYSAPLYPRLDSNQQIFRLGNGRLNPLGYEELIQFDAKSLVGLI